MCHSSAAVGGPPKSGYKSGLISTASAKVRSSSSPLPSPPERSGAAASPIGIGNNTKSHASIEDVMPPQVKSKENASSSEKEIPSRATSAVREILGRRGNFEPKPMDLQSLLISLLKEKTQGMSLKVRLGLSESFIVVVSPLLLVLLVGLVCYFILELFILLLFL